MTDINQTVELLKVDRRLGIAYGFAIVCSVTKATLDEKTRADLGSGDFAVPGRSALPIEDAAHVKDAMARFGQEQFASSGEKATAYHRILARAKKLGIDPSGFQEAHGAISKSVEDYYDLQGDHIPEDVMVKAAAEFSMGARVGKAQHQGDKVADVVFMFPLTAEIAKGLGISTERYGLIIGYKPTSPEVLDDIERGVYKGFSLGGTGIRQEVSQ